MGRTHVIEVVVALWMAVLANVMVNIKCSIVFNRVFETQKSIRIEKKYAKMRAFRAHDPHIYHIGVNHGAVLREIYSPLTRG